MANIYCIFGPTASGKTDFSIKLARELTKQGNDTIIISADSRQVYKKLDIGTGKILINEMNNIPHFGLDLVEIDSRFTAFDWVEYTKKTITENRGKKIIIVGGTGLYFSALLNGYEFTVESEDKLASIQNKSIEELIEIIGETIPSELIEKELKNRRRIERYALRALSTNSLPTSNKFTEDVLCFSLDVNRADLYISIENRVKKMYDDGLIMETKKLLAKYSADNLKTIGYLEAVEFLNSIISEAQALERTITATRNYAKRQITWFKNMKNPFPVIHLQTVEDREKILRQKFL